MKAHLIDRTRPGTFSITCSRALARKHDTVSERVHPDNLSSRHFTSALFEVVTSLQDPRFSSSVMQLSTYVPRRTESGTLQPSLGCTQELKDREILSSIGLAVVDKVGCGGNSEGQVVVHTATRSRAGKTASCLELSPIVLAWLLDTRSGIHLPGSHSACVRDPHELFNIPSQARSTVSHLPWAHPSGLRHSLNWRIDTTPLPPPNTWDRR